MMFADAGRSMLLALAYGVLLSAASGMRSPWAVPRARFPVLFLFICAGCTWMSPMGPTLYGVHWVSFLRIGFVQMLIAASSRPLPRRMRSETLAEARAEEDDDARTQRPFLALRRRPGPGAPGQRPVSARPALRRPARCDPRGRSDASWSGVGLWPSALSRRRDLARDASVG